MGDVLFLTFAFLFLFGVGGVALFGGKFRQNCFIMPNESNNLDHPLIDNNADHLCGSSESYFACDVGQECLADGPNPMNGIIGFDNILQAWVNIFTAMTLEGWVDLAYYGWETVGYYTTIYFIGLVLLLAFFITELITSVVFTSYIQAKKEAEESYFSRKLAQELNIASNDNITACHLTIFKATGLKRYKADGTLYTKRLLNPYVRVTTMSYLVNKIDIRNTSALHNLNDEWDESFPIYLSDKVACIDLEVFDKDPSKGHHDSQFLGALRIPLCKKGEKSYRLVCIK